MTGKNYTRNIFFLLFIFFLSCSAVIGQKKFPSFSGGIGTVDTKTLKLMQNGHLRMEIDNNGNVGIGTEIPPDAKLTLYTKPTAIGSSGIGFNQTDGYTLLQTRIGSSGDAHFGTNSSSTLSFMTNNDTRMFIATTGEVGIGTVSPGNYMLAVEGAIGARSIEVKATPWADFVFDKNYKLRPLKELEDFIRTHRHLPDVPSEAQVKKEGIDLGKMSATLLQKIEELTLYTIEQNKRIEAIEKENALLKERLNR